MAPESSFIRFNNPPFIYHKDMWAERTAKADCSKERVLNLLSARKFRKIDRVILYALGQYGYLNAYLLRRYAALCGFQGTDQALVKERLSFLLKNGLVFRYEFFHTDPDTATVNGSPFVYSLSGGGWMFLKMSYKMHLASSGIRNFYDFSDLADQKRISQILCLLAENQFSILFEDQYANRDRFCMKSDINGKCFSDCAQRMEYPIRFSNGRRMWLYPVAVRQNDGWELYLQDLALKSTDTR